MVDRILISERAAEVLTSLKNEHGDLMFHQSGGCCDGSAPMCFSKGELMINEMDVKLGTFNDCEFYMSKDQFECWKHTQLTLDVVKGRGASFSLEVSLGLRFVIKSRLYTEDEMERLTPL